MHHVTCQLVQRDSPATKSDRVEITFILAILYWLKPLTDEGGEETLAPRKNLDDELMKMPHTKARKFKPQPRLNPHSSIGGRLGKQLC